MTLPRRASRRRSREAALQILYAIDLARPRRGDSEPVTAQQMFEEAAGEFELPEGARAFAKDLVTGVAEKQKDLDAVIAAHAIHWRVERMGVVDRNVLRLAVYELRCTETPSEVVIDEAVELARRFGAEGSSRFVNGVLDAIVPSVRTGVVPGTDS